MDYFPDMKWICEVRVNKYSAALTLACSMVASPAHSIEILKT